MKKGGFWLLLLAGMVAFGTLRAQNTVLGERVPEIRSEKWFNKVEPATAARTIITFFTASNPASIKALDRLSQLLDEPKQDLRVILVTRDSEEEVAAVIEPYLSPRMTVAFDTENKLFKNFGVQYVPFSLLVESRNHRLLWQGNPLQLTPSILSMAR